MATYVISVGGAPRRKSEYLYVREGSKCRAVARFLSKEDAEYFKDILLGVLPVEREDD